MEQRKNKLENRQNKPFGPKAPEGRRLLFLEPFFGGSHRDFAQGLVAHSRHRIVLKTLPARFWKWRMRGAGLYWLSTLPDFHSYDGLIVTDLMSFAELKGASQQRIPPTILYFHENQLDYPLSPGEAFDVQFGFTNIASALAADRVYFNSAYQMRTFFERLPGFLKQMPDHRPIWVVDAIRTKSSVLYPGCHLVPVTPKPIPDRSKPDRTPLIVWNHRWEFDKDPDTFFRILYALKERGVAFRLALLGERYREVPACFRSAREILGDRIVQYGFVQDAGDYRRWLDQGDIAVSTAIQENFGIAMVEAVFHGCLPLLPNRLAYPEVLPERYHAHFLYRTEAELLDRLTAMVTDPDEWRDKAKGLPETMGRFSWEARITEFDAVLTALTQGAHEA